MNKYLLIIFILFAVSCSKVNEKGIENNPLPSWNEGSNKKAIMDFVTQTTQEGNPQFIPVEDRIAVFDNDGTLWCEQPLYVEMLYSKDAAETNNILEDFVISHTAVTLEYFDKKTQTWLDTAINTQFQQRYIDLTYQPMLELLQYLRNNQFKTFIVTGGSAMFVRNFSQQVYGIPSEQVIGTMFKANYKDNNISLDPDLWHNNDNAGKPEAIFNIIGKKPVLAFGNSDGDLEMLQWTSTHTLPNLALILHHTDNVREVAYDSLSSIGRLKNALIEAQLNDWIIVDMKRDFNQVFSFKTK